MVNIVRQERKQKHPSIFASAAFSVTCKSSLSGMLLFILLHHRVHFTSASALVTFNCIKTFHLAGRASGETRVQKSICFWILKGWNCFKISSVIFANSVHIF